MNPTWSRSVERESGKEETEGGEGGKEGKKDYGDCYFPCLDQCSTVVCDYNTVTTPPEFIVTYSGRSCLHLP